MKDTTIAAPPEIQKILKDAKDQDGLPKKLILTKAINTFNEYFLQNKAKFHETSEAVSSKEILNALLEKARQDGASDEELLRIKKGIDFFEGVLLRLRERGKP